VAVPEGAIYGSLGGDWSHRQGSVYSSQQAAIDDYVVNMDATVIGPVEAAPEPAVTPVGQATPPSPTPEDPQPVADPFANAPEGVRMRFRSGSLRVLDPNGQAWAQNLDGTWEAGIVRDSQSELVEWYRDNYNAEVIEDVQPVSARTETPLIPTEQWDRIGHTNQPARFTSINGTVLPEEWFQGGNGLDWSGPNIGARRFDNQPTPIYPNLSQLEEEGNSEYCDCGDEDCAERTDRTECGERSPWEGFNEPGTLGVDFWWCSMNPDHDGPHVALSDDHVLAEWNRQPEQATPALRPAVIPFTDSRGNVLPERFFTGSPNGLDWKGDTRNLSHNGRSYELPDWGSDWHYPSRQCDLQSPAFGSGPTWHCTEERGHSGHHIARSGEYALAEWGRIAGFSQSTSSVAPDGSFIPGPDHLKKSDVARVMHHFAMTHRSDNGPAALQKGMASLGIDLGDLGASTYTATVTIQVPITVTHTRPLEDLDSYQVQAALPTERIREAVGRFVSAAKLEGENFAGSQVHTEQIRVIAGSVRRSS
jgi:hypothetical protein